MSLITLLVVLLLLGLVLWVVNSLIPLDGTIRKIITVVIVVIALLYVLAAFGVLGDLKAIKVPQF